MIGSDLLLRFLRPLSAQRKCLHLIHIFGFQALDDFEIRLTLSHTYLAELQSVLFSLSIENSLGQDQPLKHKNGKLNMYVPSLLKPHQTTI